MKKRRTYKNTAEENFCQFIESLGFNVSKRGWPDFICWQNDRLICVEVKDTARHPLKKEQKFVMQKLSSFGIPCFRWDNEKKHLEKIADSQPMFSL